MADGKMEKVGGWWTRRRVLFGALGAGALAAVFAARPIAASVQGAGGWHGFHGRGGHHRMNPEAVKEHLQVALKWHLRDIDATEEQQAQIEKIVGGAVEDIASARERHRQNRAAFVAGLGSADRAALEEARKAEIALADEASRKLVQALADVAEVLTPEQRQLLLSKAERHRH